jgi:putative membrane protein
MSTAACVAIGIVGLLHVYFMILESFLWTKPAGLRVFRQTREQAEATRVLAMNQGVYNGFLAAGLFWSLTLGPNGRAVATFFLVCVVIAGVVGGLTANRKILYVQAVPAIVALLLIYLA